jgi:hypothetical protein
MFKALKTDKPKNKTFFYIIVLAAGLLGAGVFFLRAPVLLVTDAPFDALYGPTRALVKRVEVSLRLFRRVMPVLAPDGAGADVVAFTVGEAARAPYCVLFPYRYHEGAARYVDETPGVPVFVLGGGQKAEAEDVVFIQTDTRADFYRAGLCAAILAGEGAEVVVYGQVATEWREAFLAGLREDGVERVVKYLSVTDDYSDIQNVACVVMNGQATAFLEQNRDIPVILFSWLDPALTSYAIKVVFDDSPWALLTRVARGKEEGPFPSGMIFPKGRTAARTSLQRTRNKTLEESEIL